MELCDLRPAEGSRKTRKRVGRGPGSGKGKTSGRGMNGREAARPVSAWAAARVRARARPPAAA